MIRADHQPAIFSTTVDAPNVVILGCVLRIALARADEDSWRYCGYYLTRSVGGAFKNRATTYARQRCSGDIKMS